MSRDDAVYVSHMLDTARKAVEKVDRKSRADFDADENRHLAIVYLMTTRALAASLASIASLAA